MKGRLKLILVTAILYLVSSFAFGQTNYDYTFIGYWKSDSSSVRMVIFKDKNDSLQMVMWDSSDGEAVEVVKVEVTEKSIKTTEKVLSTNWTTYNTYSIINENNIKCIIGGDGNGTEIYFERLK